MEIDFFDSSKVVALFSERADGAMNLHGHPQFDAPARENRKRFLAAHAPEFPPDSIISAELIHGRHAAVVDRPQMGMRIPRVDSLITARKGILLSVSAADCPPVYIYDPINEVVALSHAGWKGIQAGVVEDLLKSMKENFNCDPERLRAFVGPGIRECHYEVGPEVAKLFPRSVKEMAVDVPILPQPANADDPGTDTWTKKKKYVVDLSLEIMLRLRGAGVKEENIARSPLCAFCAKGIADLKTPPEKSTISYRFFSWRRDREAPLRAQFAVIGIK